MTEAETKVANEEDRRARKERQIRLKEQAKKDELEKVSPPIGRQIPPISRRSPPIGRQSPPISRNGGEGEEGEGERREGEEEERAGEAAEGAEDARRAREGGGGSLPEAVQCGRPAGGGLQDARAPAGARTRPHPDPLPRLPGEKQSPPLEAGVPLTVYVPLTYIFGCRQYPQRRGAIQGDAHPYFLDEQN
eukprot:9499153-Pyramimonas_sp.AAC.1